MFTQEEITEISDYLLTVSPESRIYLGCDSQKYRKFGQWWARYTVVLIVHIDNCHGGKVFGYNMHERDFDQKASKPSMRLMNEVYKVSEVYSTLKDILADREVEIHLDINPSERWGSSCVVSSAVGYIRGVCGLDPKIKPNAFAASYAADAVVRGRFEVRTVDHGDPA